MASPQKTRRHGDDPGSVNLLGCIRNIESLDIEPDVALQCDDVDTLIQHELNLNEDPCEEGLGLDASLKELSFPHSAEEPTVSHEELQRLDAIADMVEVQRLFSLEVPQDDTLPQDPISQHTFCQRDGSLLWCRDLTGCLKECSLKMNELQAYPSLLKSQDGSFFLLVHVDDLWWLAAESDLPQCQYVIRHLSTFFSKPTQKSMVVVKHLIGYLCGHADDCVSLNWKGIHGGVFKSYESDTRVLEIFSDADWAADRQTRRSVSGSMIFFGSRGRGRGLQLHC
eukprot:s5372_g2.t1